MEVCSRIARRPAPLPHCFRLSRSATITSTFILPRVLQDFPEIALRHADVRDHDPPRPSTLDQQLGDPEALRHPHLLREVEAEPLCASPRVGVELMRYALKISTTRDDEGRLLDLALSVLS